MESLISGAVGNQKDLSATGPQSSQELVADSSSNTIRSLQERLDQEGLQRLEQET